MNAELNRAKGKGYEQAAEYQNTRLSFMNIENVHVMRASLKAFLLLLGGDAKADRHPEMRRR